MCYTCHIGLSDETILSQTQEQLNKGSTDYPDYNSTSISHFIISASGYNGLENRKKSITLLENFNKWLLLNPYYTLDKSLLSPIYLTPIIEKIKTNQITHHSKEQLQNYLISINDFLINNQWDSFFFTG